MVTTSLLAQEAATAELAAADAALTELQEEEHGCVFIAMEPLHSQLMSACIAFERVASALTLLRMASHAGKATAECCMLQSIYHQAMHANALIVEDHASMQSLA